MNVHRLLALSSSAVIVAACSGGGNSAPHATQSPAATSPTATKHAPNSSLTLKFSPNFLRLKPGSKSKTATVTRRSPNFVDPGGPNSETYFLEVLVQNTQPNGGAGTSYMAAIDVPIVVSQSNTQTIPIYLAPGNDTILVQEVGGKLGPIDTNTGYLLAQGDTTANVSEGSPSTPSITMQLVVAGADILTDVSTFSTNNSGTMSTTNSFSNGNGGYYPTICLKNNNQSIYFLPIDYESGTYAYSENPGSATTQGGGIPNGTITYSSPGTSTLVPNAFGGYTASFDQAQSPILVTASYHAAQNPSTFGPFSFATGATISLVGATPFSYYADVEEQGSADCPQPL